MTVQASHRTAIRLRVGHLIDGIATAPPADGAILVIDGRIADIGPDAMVAAPEDARSLDFPTATALPGLIDSHVHVTLPPTIDPLATMSSESDDDLVVRGVA